MHVGDWREDTWDDERIPSKHQAAGPHVMPAHMLSEVGG